MVETMEYNVDAAASIHWQDISEAQRQRRRARNREYMRRRRADPEFQKSEKRRSRARELALLSSAASSPESGRQFAGQKCWICRKRAAIEVITRLRPTAATRSGYVQVRVAYCGFC